MKHLQHFSREQLEASRKKSIVLVREHKKANAVIQTSQWFQYAIDKPVHDGEYDVCFCWGDANEVELVTKRLRAKGGVLYNDCGAPFARDQGNVWWRGVIREDVTMCSGNKTRH